MTLCNSRNILLWDGLRESNDEGRVLCSRSGSSLSTGSRCEGYDYKSQKWTKVLFHSTDCAEVTETTGNGKPIRGIRKLKAGEEPPSGTVVIKNGWTMNIVKSAGNMSIPAIKHTEASTISGSASVALREPKLNECNRDVSPTNSQFIQPDCTYGATAFPLYCVWNAFVASGKNCKVSDLHLELGARRFVFRKV